MIYASATVAVNPPGEAPLTRAQAWEGLVQKARDARLFLPPGLCTRCDVVEEGDSHIVRVATIAGIELREISAFEAQRKVTFFQATGPREGAIINELFEDGDGALQLRFYCYLGLRGKEPGGPEEQAEQAWMLGDRTTKRLALDVEAEVADGVGGPVTEGGGRRRLRALRAGRGQLRELGAAQGGSMTSSSRPVCSSCTRR